MQWTVVPVSYKSDKESLSIQFTLTLPENIYVFVALNIPFSYTDLDHYLKNLKIP